MNETTPYNTSENNSVSFTNVIDKNSPTEIMRIQPDGTILVMGIPTTNALAIGNAVMLWAKSFAKDAKDDEK